jgi:hypothetical protein
MRTRFFVWALLLIVGLSLAPAVPAAAQEATPSETPSLTPTFTETPTIEPTATFTETPTLMPTLTETPAATLTQTTTATTPVTASMTPTALPTPTPLASATFATATRTPIPTVTSYPTATSEAELGAAMSAASGTTSFDNPTCNVPTEGFNVTANSVQLLTYFIQTANADPTHLYRINLEPGIYTFDDRQFPFPPGYPPPCCGYFSAMNIYGNVVIVGLHSLADQTVIQRNPSALNSFDLFTVEPASPATCRSLRLYNVTVRNGGGPDRNGAGNILNRGVLGIYNSIIEGGRVYYDGAGILNQGYAEIVSTKIRNNHAGVQGGGFANSGTAALTCSYFEQNKALDSSGEAKGGTIFNAPTGGMLTVTGGNFTFNEVGDDGQGGAVYASARGQGVDVSNNWWGWDGGPPPTPSSTNSIVGNVSYTGYRVSELPLNCTYQPPPIPTPVGVPTATPTVLFMTHTPAITATPTPASTACDTAADETAVRTLLSDYGVTAVGQNGATWSLADLRAICRGVISTGEALATQTSNILDNRLQAFRIVLLAENLPPPTVSKTEIRFIRTDLSGIYCHRCCWRIEIKPQLSEQRQKRE